MYICTYIGLTLKSQNGNLLPFCWNLHLQPGLLTIVVDRRLVVNVQVLTPQLGMDSHDGPVVGLQTA